MQKHLNVCILLPATDILKALIMENRGRYVLYLDDHWLYFIIYSIISIIFIRKGDVMVKSHFLRIIQLFNLLNIELAPESDVDVRIYSILCSKKCVFLFSSLLLELFSTSYLNVLILLIISSFPEKLRVRI